MSFIENLSESLNNKAALYEARAEQFPPSDRLFEIGLHTIFQRAATTLRGTVATLNGERKTRLPDLEFTSLETVQAHRANKLLEELRIYDDYLALPHKAPKWWPENVSVPSLEQRHKIVERSQANARFELEKLGLQGYRGAQLEYHDFGQRPNLLGIQRTILKSDRDVALLLADNDVQAVREQRKETRDFIIFAAATVGVPFLAVLSTFLEDSIYGNAPVPAPVETYQSAPNAP